MKKQELNLMDQVFVHSEKYPYLCDENGIVTILEPQNHKIQRFLRKIGFSIPENKKMELDAYGSYVYLLINGERTVTEIGEALSQKYEGAAEQLYERLCPYIRSLYGHFHYIELASEKN